VSRIAATFAALKTQNRAALIPFVEAFDPDRATSAALLTGMAANGADIIEIGVPFTDPMADGPTIQAAGRRALGAGATVHGVLDLVREFRR
jgi:tryptophan synthase alpha chain